MKALQKSLSSMIFPIFWGGPEALFIIKSEQSTAI